MPAAIVYRSVLDSSAYLALVQTEQGWPRVAEALPTAAFVSVIAAEIYSKLLDCRVDGTALDKQRRLIQERVVMFDDDLAWRSAQLRPLSRPFGLSLGDRACLALAQRLGVPALTADQAWTKLPSSVGVAVNIIR